jgi:hypothetical protein
MEVIESKVDGSACLGAIVDAKQAKIGAKDKGFARKKGRGRRWQRLICSDVLTANATGKTQRMHRGLLPTRNSSKPGWHRRGEDRRSLGSIAGRDVGRLHVALGSQANTFHHWQLGNALRPSYGNLK